MAVNKNPFQFRVTRSGSLYLWRLFFFSSFWTLENFLHFPIFYCFQSICISYELDTWVGLGVYVMMKQQMGNTYNEVSAAHVGCLISNKVGLTPGFNRLSSRINASSFQLGSRLTPKKRLPLFSNKVFLPCHCLNIRRNDILIPHKLPVSLLINAVHI